MSLMIEPIQPRQLPQLNSSCNSSGNRNISKELKTAWVLPAGPCYQPFEVDSITDQWEQERDACREQNTCRERDVVKICYFALESRFSHFWSCGINTAWGVASPLFCAAAVAKGIACCCYSGCLYSKHACGRTKVEKDAIDASIEKTQRLAKFLCLFGPKNTAAALAIAFTETIKCPFNIIAPEACNAYAYQQECYACENQWIYSSYGSPH